MAGIFKAYDIRGLYPEQITEDIAFRVGYYFRDLLDTEDLARGPVVVVSRDMRSHSVSLSEALQKGLMARGVEVIDIGMADTPQNYFAVGHLGASGGIQVTASHNPAQYNGLKMSRRDAIPVAWDTGIEKLEGLVMNSDIEAQLPPCADRHEKNVFEDYIQHVLQRMTRHEPRLKVAVDTANGMGTIYRPILEKLNIELYPLFFELDGSFPNHEANPLKEENLVDLRELVSREACDLGVSFDGDADRAMFIDETASIVTADRITGLLAPRFIRDEKGAAIIYDLRSSWSTREAIIEAGGEPVRERVGHSFMKATMRRHNSPFGGELAGHFYYRANYTADSSIMTLIEVLEHLRESGQRLSEAVAPLNRYFATGEINFKVEDKQGMIRHLESEFSDGDIDFLDGITVQYQDWWFNVRPSNTEPYLRLVLEAKSRELMEEKKALLLSYLGTPR